MEYNYKGYYRCKRETKEEKSMLERLDWPLLDLKMKVDHEPRKVGNF